MLPYSIKSKPSLQKAWMERFRGDIGNGTDGVSAATYNPKTNNWIVVRQVSSANGHIYEYDSDLNLIRTIAEAGDWHDTESIDWLYDDVYLVVEENRTAAPTQHRANIVKLTGTTVHRTNDAVAPAFFVGSGWFNANLGVEGMAYDKARNKYYFTYEKEHATSGWHIWELETGAPNTLPATRSVIPVIPLVTGLTTDFSDVYLDSAKSNLYVCSDEGDKVFVFSLPAKTLLYYMNLPVGGVTTGETAGFGQPEGIALNYRMDKMLIVGENRQGGTFRIRKCGNTVGVGTNPVGITNNQRYL